MVNVVEVSRLPLGPLMVVDGLWSSKLNVSIFLTALTGSLAPPVLLNALAMICRFWLPAMPAGSVSDQVVELAFGRGQGRVDVVATLPHVVRSSCRYCLLSRFWISTCTRLTPPLATWPCP